MAFVAFVVADFLVILVIWLHTWRSGASLSLRPRVGSQVSLINVLVRDGELQYTPTHLIRG